MRRDRRPRRAPRRVPARRSRRAAARRPSLRDRRRGAARTIVESAAAAGAKLVAKSKSMATEEIGLNEALEAAGVQRRRDRPRRVHPPARRRAPGAHHRAGDREDRRRTSPSCFSRVDGREVSTELEELTQAARARSCARRSSTADVGITGANFGGRRDRLDLPRRRTRATAGSSRPCRASTSRSSGWSGSCRRSPTSSVLLRLLARSATGQKLSSYTTLITGPAPRRASRTGPRSCTS